MVRETHLTVFVTTAARWIRRSTTKEWRNTLTVSSDVITLALKDGKKVEIPPKSVAALSYGQEAHRRVGTMIYC
jgi:hypothetical protein